jgi:hypothetical protein
LHGEANLIGFSFNDLISRVWRIAEYIGFCDCIAASTGGEIKRVGVRCWGISDFAVVAMSDYGRGTVFASRRSRRICEQAFIIDLRWLAQPAS